MQMEDIKVQKKLYRDSARYIYNIISAIVKSVVLGFLLTAVKHFL
jgi:hypothetical protein